MQFVKQEKVLASINEQSEKEINAVNGYIDRIKGTVVSVEVIRAGQPGPYQDSVYEALIFCHQPNCKTTNAPLTRVINVEQAKAIARIFLCDFSDTPESWSSPKLQFIRPEKNPCGLEENTVHSEKGLHACWRVRVTMEYTG